MGNSHLPCFDGRPRQVVDELRDRLMPHINDAGIVILLFILLNQWFTNAIHQCAGALLYCCWRIPVTAAREVFESCVMAAVGHWRYVCVT